VSTRRITFSRMLVGDALTELRSLPDRSINCCVTSPPYWGLRSYLPDGHPLKPLEMGLERTAEEYIEKLVSVFCEVHRVLRADGTLWLNLGDCYASTGGAGWQGKHGARSNRSHTQRSLKKATATKASGLKPKYLVGIPWRVALALRAAGWWLRSDCIWHKPNPIPESVTDRPTKSHEYVFMLSKSRRYYFDGAAVREPDAGRDHARTVLGGQPSLEPTGGRMAPHRGLRTPKGRDGLGRNIRSVWTVATVPFTGAHSACFPPMLAERCILASCPQGGSVLDPFAGAGTTGLVAHRLGRIAVLVELNPDYARLAEKRIFDDAPLLAILLQADRGKGEASRA
jgi:DNA modification methylase